MQRIEISDGGAGWAIEALLGALDRVSTFTGNSV